jgi:hypothetical protein
LYFSAQSETRGSLERRITDNYYGGGTGLMQQTTIETSQMNRKLIDMSYFLCI